MADNPYRSPEGMEGGRAAAVRQRRKRIRGLALAGLFFGIAYGAATGAAVAVVMDAVANAMWLAEPRAAGEFMARLDMWLVEFAAVVFFQAILGAVSGAVLGPIQGVLAGGPAACRVCLVRFGAFCWALVAVVWCLALDQAVLVADPRRWPLYVALAVVPLAAGFGGARVAVKLARLADREGG